MPTDPDSPVGRPAGPDAAPWAPGDTVLYRYLRHDQVRHVHPMVVVADRPTQAVLWLPPGTPIVDQVLADGRSFRTLPVHQRFAAARHPEVRPWRGTGILKLVPHPPAPSAVWLFWHADGSFRGWYGNLEDPPRRWTRSDGVHVVDTTDHVLDVWCPADGPPEWKDEDEFAVVRGLPGFGDDAHRARVRAEGERLFALAVRRAAPFDHAWTGFTPDPSWPAPPLPDDWAATPPATV